MTSKVREGIAAAQVAVTFDESHDYKSAIEQYNRAISLLQEGLTALDADRHAALRQTTASKIDEYSRRIEQLSRQVVPVTSATLRPSRSTAVNDGSPSVPPLSRQRSLSNGARRSSSNVPLSGEEMRLESVNAAKLTLNNAMNADRSGDLAGALALYEAGLDQLMQLLKSCTDAAEKQWITGEVRRHLARAEAIKAALKSRVPTGSSTLSEADDAWDAGEYERALPLYERAKEMLRLEMADRPDAGDQLAHAEVRIELLVTRANDGGEFVRPIPLGHKPGERYVDPVGERTRLEKFKEKAQQLKRTIATKFQDDPW
jgi:tetratricopeptide (TPR) repeat protein